MSDNVFVLMNGFYCFLGFFFFFFLHRYEEIGLMDSINFGGHFDCVLSLINKILVFILVFI